MHTLMLHGHATSALIFKAQTIAFRSKLGKTFTFDFVDGPYPCAPPPELASIIPSAHTWWKKADTDGIREAVQWLIDYIGKNGPYDCICCFSKAAVVVAAMVMYEGRRGTGQPTRFMPKSVVFMNGSIEYSFLEDLGLPITAEARAIQNKVEELVKSKGDAMSRLSRALRHPGAGCGIWDDVSQLIHEPKKLPLASDCFGLDLALLPADVLINIPTVHIVGAKDPLWPSGIQLAHLCASDKRSFYDHQGGHGLPSSPNVAADIAQIFRALARDTTFSDLVRKECAQRLV